MDNAAGMVLVFYEILYEPHKFSSELHSSQCTEENLTSDVDTGVQNTEAYPLYGLCPAMPATKSYFSHGAS